MEGLITGIVCASRAFMYHSLATKLIYGKNLWRGLNLLDSYLILSILKFDVSIYGGGLIAQFDMKGQESKSCTSYFIWR